MHSLFLSPIPDERGTITDARR